MVDMTLAAWRAEIAEEMATAQAESQKARAELAIAEEARAQAAAYHRQLAHLVGRMSRTGHVAAAICVRLEVLTIDLRDSVGRVTSAKSRCENARHRIIDLDLALAQIDAVANSDLPVATNGEHPLSTGWTNLAQRPEGARGPGDRPAGGGPPPADQPEEALA